MMEVTLYYWEVKNFYEVWTVGEDTKRLVCSCNNTATAYYIAEQHNRNL